MYFVYAISSSKKDWIYVGFTNNLERRLKQHNSGQVKSTKAYRPFTLLFTEECESRIEARQKEKHYKSGVGKAFLKNLTTS